MPDATHTCSRLPGPPHRCSRRRRCHRHHHYRCRSNNHNWIMHRDTISHPHHHHRRWTATAAADTEIARMGDGMHRHHVLVTIIAIVSGVHAACLCQFAIITIIPTRAMACRADVRYRRTEAIHQWRRMKMVRRRWRQWQQHKRPSTYDIVLVTANIIHCHRRPQWTDWWNFHRLRIIGTRPLAIIGNHKKVDLENFSNEHINHQTPPQAINHPPENWERILFVFFFTLPFSFGWIGWKTFIPVWILLRAKKIHFWILNIFFNRLNFDILFCCLLHYYVEKAHYEQKKRRWHELQTSTKRQANKNMLF